MELDVIPVTNHRQLISELSARVESALHNVYAAAEEGEGNRTEAERHQQLAHNALQAAEDARAQVADDYHKEPHAQADEEKQTHKLTLTTTGGVPPLPSVSSSPSLSVSVNSPSAPVSVSTGSTSNSLAIPQDEPEVEFFDLSNDARNRTETQAEHATIAQSADTAAEQSEMDAELASAFGFGSAGGVEGPQHEQGQGVNHRKRSAADDVNARKAKKARKHGKDKDKKERKKRKKRKGAGKDGDLFEAEDSEEFSEFDESEGEGNDDFEEDLEDLDDADLTPAERARKNAARGARRGADLHGQLQTNSESSASAARAKRKPRSKANPQPPAPAATAISMVSSQIKAEPKKAAVGKPGNVKKRLMKKLGIR